MSYSVTQFFKILAFDQFILLVWVQLPDRRHETLLVLDVLNKETILDELNGHAVSFKSEHGIHVFLSLASYLLAKVQEILYPQLFQQHSHDFRVLLVHFLEDFFDVFQVIHFLDLCDLHVEVLTKGSVCQNGLVDEPLIRIVEVSELFQFFDEAHGVCGLQQSFGVGLALDAVDDVDDVVDHVGDLALEEEFSEGFVCIGHEEVPLVLEFIGDLGPDDIDSQVLNDFTHEVFLITVGQKGFDVR